MYTYNFMPLSKLAVQTTAVVVNSWLQVYFADGDVMAFEVGNKTFINQNIYKDKQGYQPIFDYLAHRYENPERLDWHDFDMKLCEVERLLASVKSPVDMLHMTQFMYDEDMPRPVHKWLEQFEPLPDTYTAEKWLGLTDQ